MLEHEGLKPAPYMARIFWVAAERWGAWSHREWQGQLRAAHAITLGKLTKRTLAVLALPEKEREKVVADRRRVWAAKSK